ncbi:hypothetical protein AXF42_Ash010489 [Apostasia shenzhenica]|uniref:FLZ-type domain-containing protein n=1 Tax=Apostasia shenzhenica TaxID=1088818 RepID=A0A2I0BE55_9ASPA|nr:hypothetical protein AXF42_Ash010489 [Apostasia shenzhenica]
MLKKRSRAVSSRQFTSRPTSSPFPLPGVFVGLPPKGFKESEAAAMSPTSTLEMKPFVAAGNPRAGSLSNTSPPKHHGWDDKDPRTVGLAIVDSLSNEKSDEKPSKGECRMVLFGPQLKVQIPSTSQNSVFDPNTSLIEFGVKNKDSQLAMALLSPARRSSLADAAPTSEPSPQVFSLSAREMELSEDYTRVVSHGPNPTTTHIYDNCIIKSSSNGFSFYTGLSGNYPSEDFLSFCRSCWKRLGQGKDIFMYRGEKAFCSEESRNKSMLLDDGRENSTRCGSLDL